ACSASCNQQTTLHRHGYRDYSNRNGPKEAPMMSRGCLAVALLCFLSDADEKERAVLDRDEARKALDYLNKVRKEPAKFSKEIGVDLSDVKARPALKWNDILAKVAEEKALDMANRDYFGHVTPEGLGINIQIHEAGYSLPKD